MTAPDTPRFSDGLGRREWWIAGGVVVALATLLISWGWMGASFYRQVVPFYDSLSCQEGFRETAELTRQVGRWSALGQIWTQPRNNMVLYKFAAVALSPAGWDRAGLYVYLFAIHGAALLALGAVVWRASRSPALAVWAMAAWLSARPFAMLRDGVGDQRMDWASASFCLLVTASMLAWSRRPGWRLGAAAGTAAALAVLHRPVMGSTFAVIVVIFALRAVLEHRRRARDWWRDALAVAAPGVVIALPWLVAHFETLRYYYLDANVDVGNAPSVMAAAAFNGRRLAQAIGWVYAAMVVAGLAGLGWRRRLDWLDAGAVLLATLVPLATLAFSRSMGNNYVGQLAAGLPALLLAAARPAPGAEANRPAGRRWLAGAGVAWLAMALFSVASQEGELLAASGNPLRGEADATVRAVVAQTGGGRLAAFQDLPVNLVALAVIAREDGLRLMAGQRAYHAPEFGLPNLPLATISEEQMRQAAAEAINRVATSDDLLLLATAETEHRLHRGLFSHRLMPYMRNVVTQDARFERLEPVGPVGGIRFDLFRVRR